MTTHHSTRSGRGILDRSPPTVAVMWAAIAASVGLLLVLLTQGWGPGAWGIAAGVLLLSCIAVCVWAAFIGHHSNQEVERVVARLAETRRRAAQDRTR
jgi:hypothetical protein